MTRGSRQALPALVLADGKFVPEGEPAVPATDRGFLLGVGVFETVRVERGVPLFLEEHLARMARGALVLSLPPPILDPSAAVAQYLGQTGLDRGVIRLTRTAGVGGGAPGSLYVTARPPPDPMPDEVGLDVSEHRKLAGDPLERVKSISRVRSALARDAAAAWGAFDALVRTSEGDFVEGTASNLFVVAGGAVRTPPVGRGALAGVVRDLLIRDLPGRGVAVSEGRIEEEDLRIASEVLVSNAVVGPVAARTVRGLRDNLPGRAGEIARAARAVYRDAAEDYLRRRKTPP